ncbi:MAG: bifunctional phosphopantothenoylcysteine decarboxylase/phosphopantothenate--cysteine ligase CoaBC [Candidatus Kariarchaeaceae archaeon]
MSSEQFLSHPAKMIVGSIDSRLNNQKILIGVTGSSAIFLAPELARLLMRHGATVQFLVSPDALTMIGKPLLEWATGEPVISEITGKIEHISFAGTGTRGTELMIVFPSTANTIAKLSTGISDTPVSLVGASMLGQKIPMVIVPAMHESLYFNPATQENLKILESRGVIILTPSMSEGKAKIATVETVCNTAIKLLTLQSLKGKKVLVTAGPTREKIDNVRFVTNGSTGKMGIALAREAYFRGGDVTLVLGPTNEPVPSEMVVIEVESARDMLEKSNERVQGFGKDDLIILTAAVADFTPKTQHEGKISSDGELIVHFKKTEKIAMKVREFCPEATLVLFKAEWGLSEDQLIESALSRLNETKSEWIIANDLSEKGAGFGTDTNKVIILSSENFKRKVTNTKSIVAKEIFDDLTK